MRDGERWRSEDDRLDGGRAPGRGAGERSSDRAERSLGRLDPSRDPVGWERAVRSIVAAAEPELRRRRGSFGLLLDSWARPILAAAASLTLLASGSLYWSATSPNELSRVGAGFSGPALEEAIFPPVVADWLGGDGQPTVEDLVFASSNGD